MADRKTYDAIAEALENAQRNFYVAEMHLQCIKYSEILENVSGREFCEAMGLKPAWGTEFTKMKKISSRLRKAGLVPENI